jgi:uncharacterized membrane protein
MLAFAGTALACLALAGWALYAGDGRATVWILAGAALYLVGMFGVTVAANVPLNDALATVAPQASDAAARWSSFLGDWLPWNAVRSAAGLAASGMFAIALRAGGAGYAATHGSTSPARAPRGPGAGGAARPRAGGVGSR